MCTDAELKKICLRLGFAGPVVEFGHVRLQESRHPPSIVDLEIFVDTQLHSPSHEILPFCVNEQFYHLCAYKSPARLFSHNELGCEGLREGDCSCKRECRGTPSLRSLDLGTLSLQTMSELGVCLILASGKVVPGSRGVSLSMTSRRVLCSILLPEHVRRRTPSIAPCPSGR